MIEDTEQKEGRDGQVEKRGRKEKQKKATLFCYPLSSLPASEDQEKSSI